MGTGDTKRYQLVLPRSLYGKLQEAANARHMTVSALLRKCVQSGLFIEAALRDGKRLSLHDETGEKEIVWDE